MYTLITLTLLLAIFALGIRLARLRKISKELAHRFDETSLILESLQDGIIECDMNMVPTRINHVAEVILGIEASNIVNRPVEKTGATNEIDKVLSMVLFPPKDKSASYDVILPPPQDKKLRIFTLPKTNPGTKALTGFIKLIRDVSIETVVERHKSDLVSVVSHQLLTPLTGIKWILKSLTDGDGGTLTEKQRQMIVRGMSTNEDMIGLVTDILDVTKVEQAQFTYHKEPRDIISFVGEIILTRREKAEAHKVTVLKQANVPQFSVSFDKERLGIALGNLLDNAIDYSPQDSEVEVSITSQPGEAVIKVSDKGIGIPESEWPHIFTKFYRAENARKVRSSGTGLGLYLVKHIIEDHGGKISFETRPGMGTSFTITLPVEVRV